MALVECVPNFSEGRDKGVIDAIIASIESVDGAKVLDIEIGDATNRTVVTFIGGPEAVEEAAFRMMEKAKELIDMSTHTGEHPRMGATDVCPFVPVSGISMEDCVAISKRVAERVGSELGIPIYLYEESASKEERRNLAVVRRGQYEGLEAKLADPDWAPDFGPTDFNGTVRSTGATTMGAREFLIAYNVNVNSKDRIVARDVAFAIRETGRAKRDAEGEIVRDEDGKAIKIPGRLKAVKAIGWYIDEYARAQVSINLINYRTTPLHIVFETCVEEAENIGARVTGSELIGLVPKEALVEAGRYYLKRQGRSTGIPERDVIDIAVASMGLNEFSAFVPEERIVECIVAEKDELPALSCREFTDELSRDSPAPGGGSVASLVGSISAGLSAMVAVLTHGKKGFEDHWVGMDDLGARAQALKDELMVLVDRDTDAFNEVMSAIRMKKKTDEEKEARARAMELAYLNAAKVPLETMKRCMEALNLARDVAENGNPNAISDAGSAVMLAHAGAVIASMNVKINLKEVDSLEEKEDILDEVERLLKEADELTADVMKTINDKGEF